MELLIQLAAVLVLLGVGFLFGLRAEHRHYGSIRAREEEMRDLVVLSSKNIPSELMHHRFGMVSGSVVISVDYFKVVVAGLRNLVGGRIRSYESLLDRARREALLRMQAQAQAVGATVIVNARFETSQISGNAGKGIGSVEVLAYGTALIPPEKP